MKFSTLIATNLDPIVEEWEAFAKTLLPASAKMSNRELRDHVREMLLAIAHDMETSQSEEERSAKSKNMTRGVGAPATAASTHGGLRLLAGFDLMQLVGEFRALRASVLRYWSTSQDSIRNQPVPEEIARFNEALDQALAESVERYSSEAATSRDMFLAVLGHDVRGPLSSIRLASDALSSPTLPEGMRDQVIMRIRRAGEAISRLSTDLLEYTRTRLGHGIPVTRSACDFRQVCEDALEIVRGSHPGHQFTHRFSGELRTACDIPRMQQVLTNLLNNAVQHGDPRQPVILEAFGQPEEVILRVQNFGTPIPADAVEAIFEPLVQIRQADGELHEQTRTSLGLGLFIVREIVHGHQGTIAVESSAQAGTIFTVKLPRVSEKVELRGLSISRTQCGLNQRT